MVAYLRRFVINASLKPSRRAGSSSIPELDDAMFCIVRMVQKESFAADLQSVRHSKRIPSQSNLLRLSPILVEDILRVLCVAAEQAPLYYSAQYPSFYRSGY